MRIIQCQIIKTGWKMNGVFLEKNKYTMQMLDQLPWFIVFVFPIMDFHNCMCYFMSYIVRSVKKITLTKSYVLSPYISINMHVYSS